MTQDLNQVNALKAKDLDHILDLWATDMDMLGVELHRLWHSRDALRNATVPEVKELTLNADQQIAWDKIVNWLNSDQCFFALKGVAGSGKSFLMQRLAKLNYNFHFSAPTNKAAKVLSEFLGDSVRTTYSLLGLRMAADEESMVLTQFKPPDLGQKPIVVIDEAGMVSAQLIDIIVELGYRVLFVGDPAQLTPVGEARSKAWQLAGKNRALLLKVERFDNQLLSLSVALRQCIKQKNYKSPIVNNFTGQEGVFVKTRKQMNADIASLSLADWRTTKVCCWRNTEVAAYNDRIRKGLGFIDQYVVGEQILLATPVLEFGVIKGYVDEELVVKQINPRVFSVEGQSIPGYAITVEGRNWCLAVPADYSDLQAILSKLAAQASQLSGSSRRSAWDKFWEIKNKFHNIRYGYALTAHRLQGTTLDRVFVDQADLLANTNKREAFRCLYVAATRAKVSLTTY